MNYVFSVPGAIVASGALLFVVMKAFDYFAPQPQRRPPPPPPPPVIKRDYTLAGVDQWHAVVLLYIVAYFVDVEIADCRGEGGRPLLTAINGYVFDLASHPTGPSFYGPGETYHVFTGRWVLVRCVYFRGRECTLSSLCCSRFPSLGRRDATIMFAKTELSAKAVEGLTLESLNIGERDTLRDWVRPPPSLH